MSSAKEVMFIYNGDEEHSDLETDETGEVTVPIDGCEVKRKGRQWRVARTRMQSGSTDLMPMLKINLTDQY